MSEGLLAGLAVVGVLVVVAAIVVGVLLLSRRAKKELDADSAKAQATEQAAAVAQRRQELESLTDTQILYQVRLLLEKNQEIQEAQLRHLSGIGTAASVWLALTILGLVAACIIWLTEGSLLLR